MEKGQRAGRFEITMYKLLVIFLLSIFIAIGVGGFFGQQIGYSDAINELSVPEYCSVQRHGDDPASVECSEINDLTASEVCQLFSSPIRDQIRCTIVG